VVGNVALVGAKVIMLQGIQVHGVTTPELCLITLADVRTTNLTHTFSSYLENNYTSGLKKSPRT